MKENKINWQKGKYLKLNFHGNTSIIKIKTIQHENSNMETN